MTSPAVAPPVPLAAPAEPAAPAAAAAGADVLDRAWALSPAVSIRPESFGAMAYHFGTRRLSFLKSRVLLAVVQSLADHPDARSACAAAGVTAAQQPGYATALATLASTDMIVERSTP